MGKRKEEKSPQGPNELPSAAATRQSSSSLLPAVKGEEMKVLKPPSARLSLSSSSPFSLSEEVSSSKRDATTDKDGGKGQRERMQFEQQLIEVLLKVNDGRTVTTEGVVEQLETALRWMKNGESQADRGEKEETRSKGQANCEEAVIPTEQQTAQTPHQMTSPALEKTKVALKSNDMVATTVPPPTAPSTKALQEQPPKLTSSKPENIIAEKLMQVDGNMTVEDIYKHLDNAFMVLNYSETLGGENQQHQHEQQQQSTNQLKYNGLCKAKINFPDRIVNNLPYKVDFKSDAPIGVLAPTACRKLKDTVSSLTPDLREKGFVKVKIFDANDGEKETEWMEHHRTLRNTLRSTNDVINLPEAEVETTGQLSSHHLPSPTTGSIMSSSSSLQQQEEHQSTRPKRLAKTNARKKINEQAEGRKEHCCTEDLEAGEKGEITAINTRVDPSFLELLEIRNLGSGMFHLHRHYPKQAIERLPELIGVTVGQLVDFFHEILGCHSTNESSREENETNGIYFLRLLHSLPTDPEMEKQGLLIPTIVDWNNRQINKDQISAGLGVDGSNDWINKVFRNAIRDQQKITLNIENENHSSSGDEGGLWELLEPPPQPLQDVIESTKMVHGFAATPIPMQMGHFNGINMLDHLIVGSPKLSFIIPPRYSHKLRKDAEAFIKKIAAKTRQTGIPPFTHQPSTVDQSVLQHEQFFITPLFLKKAMDDVIPYSAVLQQKGEMLILGAGGHYGGLCLGPNLSRYTCFLAGDYHISTTELTIQSSKHEKLTRELIWKLNEQSKAIEEKASKKVLQATD